MTERRDASSTLELRSEFGELTNNGALTRRQALKVLAERHRMAVNELYRLLDERLTDGQ